MHRKPSLLLLLVPMLWGAAPAVRADNHSPWTHGPCLVLDIRKAGEEGVARLTGVSGLEVWVELDTEFFACGSDAARAELSRLAPVLRDVGVLDRDRLRLTLGLHRTEQQALGVRVLATGGRFAIVETSDSRDEKMKKDVLGLLPFLPNVVLARQRSDEPPGPKVAAVNGSVRELVEQVDRDRWFADVTTLAAYNRFTHGSEIDEARLWLERRFNQLLGDLPGATVESQQFVVEGARVSNVIATLPGRTRPDDWYILGGHYDSVSEDPFVLAPGAEDNASGCAGVLEAARIFSGRSPEATILFICYAGEEQGLFGSVDHVRRLRTAGDSDKIRAMISLDMISYDADSDLGCILEADTSGERLVEALAASAQFHTSLRIATSLHDPLRSRCCSDHAPYAAEGMLAVLAITDDSDIYPHWHRTTDLPEHVTPEMAEHILRMVVGFLAASAGAGELSGCLEVEGEPLTGARVVLKQAQQRNRRMRSDESGCFAFNSLVSGKKFQIRVEGPRLESRGSRISACVALRGEPLAARPARLRQSGELRQAARTGDRGCVAFDSVAAKKFKLTVRGPRVPE
ncbi:MAG: M28 family peptidase [Thermoanaerobaculia bacterium]